MHAQLRGILSLTNGEILLNPTPEFCPFIQIMSLSHLYIAQVIRYLHCINQAYLLPRFVEVIHSTMVFAYVNK